MDAVSPDRAQPAPDIAGTFRLRGAPIIHDTIDNETIAINQLSGAYYSIDGPAAEVWQLLGAGASATDIARRLAPGYGAPEDELAAAVADFLALLLEEQLIVPAEPDHELGHEAGAGAVGQPPTPTAAPGAERPRARLPELRLPALRLQRYTDLEVLLLADPIHEVDETGWPMPLADRE